MFRMHAFNKLLAGWFLFIGLLIACRMYITRELLFIFLVWNLFLAWIPFYVSALLQLFKQKRRVSYLLLITWLLFFPNSLYIITDLIHVGRGSDFPRWFDAILIFSAAVLGLLMAFISLYRVEQFLETKMKQRVVHALMIFILFLGSFGVYLGRFLRWNSWDVLHQPHRLFVSIGERILYPVEYWYAWGITAMFTVLFYLIYFSAKKLPGYLNRAKQDLNESA
ncbi:MAG TPA: DUF1361 domain-containing protein [Ferruginibacter sp.]|nr:DUF1361 domain-containing protein [Ferruginibacter sp.]